MSNLANIAIIVVVSIVLLIVLYFILIAIFYKKIPQGEALVRTGFGGTAVAFDKGLYVIPVLHKVEIMDISIKKIEIIVGINPQVMAQGWIGHILINYRKACIRISVD